MKLISDRLQCLFLAARGVPGVLVLSSGAYAMYVAAIKALYKDAGRVTERTQLRYRGLPIAVDPDARDEAVFVPDEE